MTWPEWVVVGLCVFFGLVIVGSLVGRALLRRDRGHDWSQMYREHHHR